MTLAASNGTLAAHVHVEGFERFHRDSFNKRQVRYAMRKAGRRVESRAKLNLALAGSGSNYPRKLRGVLRDSIKTRVSRSGFLVKIMPDKTAGMAEYYPAYLHYGVTSEAWRSGRKPKGDGKRQTFGRSNWHVKPRNNYVADALQDEAAGVRADLSQGFHRALG
ncbi:hypothetical protein [Comamonas jiangduensis]|uniref:hypothetical protein n=1 Tax=Comamonas jiangduensis TaxID=1194168 RepID=UPI0024E1554E|nr:hypothetical protein [Comamonas jiangduensis]